MRLSYAGAGIPALLVLSGAVAVALGTGAPDLRPPALKVGTDLGRVRAYLMAASPVGTPTDLAFERLRKEGLACTVSLPPLANLTWRIIRCATAPAASGTLVIDVAARNGVVADIGVEDLACAARADVTDPDPEPGGCDLSGKRLLAVETTQRAAAGALVAEVLGAAGSAPHQRP